MKPAAFEYEAPETVDEVLEILAADPEAELMAGNQSLGIIMANRLATPDRIVDLNRVADLDFILVGDRTVEIGAMVRHRRLERSRKIHRTTPVLAEAAGEIAGPSVRNRGTIGGSIAEADPAANLPAALMALDGTLELRSAEGTRTVSIDDFLVGYMFTDLAPEELITSITVPTDSFPTDRSGMAFRSQKRAGHTWPVVTAVAAIRVDDPSAETPRIERAAIVIGNAAAVPIRVPDAEAALEGVSVAEAPLAAVESHASAAADPSAELHADEEYKRNVAGVYGRRAVSAALDRIPRNQSRSR